MTNNKIRLAMMLIFAMAAAGWARGSQAKSITVTGITEKTGDAGIIVLSSFADDGVFETFGKGSISDNAVTFSLRNMEQDTLPWVDKGSFYLILRFSQDDSNYIYTDGKTLAELGINKDAFTTKLQNPKALDPLVPKYKISSTSSTIPFKKFVRIN